MLDIIKTKSDIVPSKVIDLRNGQWFYNYDIRKVQSLDMESQSSDRYEYVQVRIDGKPTYKKCVEQVIRAFITQSQEFDLINTYNRSKLGLLSEEDKKKAETDYLNYLALVTEIKSRIKQDFE